MTNYSRGTQFERRIKEDLETNGYFAVRAAGSHGKADIVAIKAGQILLVQCKTNGVISPGDREDLFGLGALTGGIPIIAYRPTPHTRAFRELLNPSVRGGTYRPFVIDQIAAVVS